MNENVKKVTVEFENGSTVEFNDQVILFAEDELCGLEKAIHAGKTKVCCVAYCDLSFQCLVVKSALKLLEKEGLDAAVILEHICDR